MLKQLPNELLMSIFAFMMEKEIYRSINLVCKEFQSIVSSEMFWKMRLRFKEKYERVDVEKDESLKGLRNTTCRIELLRSKEKKKRVWHETVMVPMHHGFDWDHKYHCFEYHDFLITMKPKMGMYQGKTFQFLQKDSNVFLFGSDRKVKLWKIRSGNTRITGCLDGLIHFIHSFDDKKCFVKWKVKKVEEKSLKFRKNDEMKDYVVKFHPKELFEQVKGDLKLRLPKVIDSNEFLSIVGSILKKKLSFENLSVYDEYFRLLDPSYRDKHFNCQYKDERKYDFVLKSPKEIPENGKTLIVFNYYGEKIISKYIDPRIKLKNLDNWLRDTLGLKKNSHVFMNFVTENRKFKDGYFKRIVMLEEMNKDYPSNYCLLFKGKSNFPKVYSKKLHCLRQIETTKDLYKLKFYNRSLLSLGFDPTFNIIEVFEVLGNGQIFDFNRGKGNLDLVDVNVEKWKLNQFYRYMDILKFGKMKSLFRNRNFHFTDLCIGRTEKLSFALKCLETKKMKSGMVKGVWRMSVN